MPTDSRRGREADLTLTTRSRDQTLEVTLAGDLDMAAAFKFEPELDQLLTASDARALVLDLADVGFVDSAGLGSLLSIRERAGQLGIEMTVVHLSDPIRRILDLSATHDILRG